MENKKLVLFQIGTQTYGMSMEYVFMIENIKEVIPVPNAPQFIDGILNLRGEIIPVYSLHKKLKIEEDSSSVQNQFIIAKSEAITCAFKVDGVSEIIEVSNKEFHEPPAVIKADETAYVEGIVNHRGLLILAINADYMMNEAERKNMNKIVKQFETVEQ